MFADLAVRIYRTIPAAVRGALWGWYFPTPTSHLYKAGDGWSVIRTLTGDSKAPRPPLP